MKKLLALTFLAFSLFSASAQTNKIENLITNEPGWTLASMFTGHAANDALQAAKDGISFIEGATNNGVITLETGVLYAKEAKSTGGFLNAYLPVGGTNSVLGAGFGLAYLDHNLYDCTLNARLGDTITVPLIKLPLYVYVESGGGYNISKSQGIAQAFAGVAFRVPITHSQTFTIGVAMGTISDVPGNVMAYGASYTLKFGK